MGVATAIITACSKSHNVDQAQQIFEKIFGGSNTSINPDELTFHALLSSYLSIDPPNWSYVSVCARTNDIKRGEEIINKMVVLGIRPNKATYESVKMRKSLRLSLRKVFKIPN